MEYTIINGITFLLGVIFLYIGYYLVKRGQEDIGLFVITGAIGSGLIVVAVYPGVFDIIARIFGLEMRARAIFVASNLTQFIIIVYLFTQIGRLDSKISKLNEELSLRSTERSESEDE
jgi:hypothetical protein